MSRKIASLTRDRVTKEPPKRFFCFTRLRGWDSNPQLTPYTCPLVSKRGGLYHRPNHNSCRAFWYLVSTALRSRERFPRCCLFASLRLRVHRYPRMFDLFSNRKLPKSTGSHSTIELPRNVAPNWRTRSIADLAVSQKGERALR